MFQGKTIYLLLLFFTCILLIVCSSIADLTKTQIRKYELTQDDLLYIQYYIKGNIVLRKEGYKKTVEIPGHKVEKTEEKKIEDVIVNYRTPCVPIYVSDNIETIEVDFGNDLYFKFATSKSEAYQIVEEQREGKTYEYRGEEYKIKFDFGVPRLQFRKSDASNFEHNKEYAPGKKFD